MAFSSTFVVKVLKNNLLMIFFYSFQKVPSHFRVKNGFT
ncbi:hypothetical protein KR50_33090 [Jeotgalibacillus campisalis]|uniref:Uncharacterized protein n=1 Tax=Jeotgalibacillus campisalis TaxID=220754 RepID=A0A0C2VED9_9BACL|nr:hypothetical protein KR50_33090 [Jeotgalibacillus campisalis]